MRPTNGHHAIPRLNGCSLAPSRCHEAGEHSDPSALAAGDSKLCWCPIVQTAMWPLFVVVAAPESNLPPVRQTDSGTNLLVNTLRAVAHGSFLHARSAWACRAGYARARSSARYTKPENDGWSVRGRCRSESTLVLL